MADRSAENLRRIRAWDAEWDESKHNRADNGQFTSGGGVTVSKATPAMKGRKFNNPIEASWKANEAIKKESGRERKCDSGRIWARRGLISCFRCRLG